MGLKLPKISLDTIKGAADITQNLKSSPGNAIGKALNSITGASDAARRTQKYAIQSAELSNQFQKEFAQNQHQWEVEDLEKAGINPILYAGGGAPAGSGSVNSAQMSSSGHTPMDIASAISSILQQATQNKLTKAQTETAKATLPAEVNNKNQDTLTKQSQQQLNERLMDEATARIASHNAQTLKTIEETKKIEGGQGSNLLGTKVEKNPFIAYTFGKLPLPNEEKNHMKNVLKNKEDGAKLLHGLGLHEEAKKIEKQLQIMKKKGFKW